MEVEFIMKKLAIYVHIPFCKQKCKYCDFTSFANLESRVSQYVTALLKEIREYSSAKKGYIVTSVYFGGGTPSFIDENLIEKIYNEIKDNYVLNDDIEVTIEANPGTISSEKLKKYHDIGFNRISFGVQSLSDKLLKEIGRVHTASDAIEGFYMARDAGFTNISLDLMFGLPNQTLKDVEDTLDGFIRLNPEHISTYSLKVEENTTFGKLQSKGKLTLPSDEVERGMYYLIKEKLKNAGYEHYEISNFGKIGFESRHNTAYWERQAYLGFGLGASSCFNEVRFKNTDDFDKYINDFKKNIEGREVLSEEVINSEKIILGLRMLKGISKEYLVYDRWRASAKKLINLGLLEEKGEILRLTDRGLDLANQVFVEFIE